MLAIQHGFTRMLEDLVRDPHQTHRIGTRSLVEVGWNGINRVPNKNRPEELKFGITLAEGGYAVVFYQAEPKTEDKGACCATRLERRTQLLAKDDIFPQRIKHSHR
jgi:hypothetical protein